LVLSACSSSTATSAYTAAPPTTAATTSGSSAAAPPTTAATTSGSSAAATPAYIGGTVDILGHPTGAEADDLVASLNTFAGPRGITIKYEGSPDFETDVRTRTAGGNLPDIGIFPQPGLVAAVSSYLTPLSTLTSQAQWTSATWPGLTEMGTVNNVWLAGAMGMSIRGLVYYSKSAFQQAGYAIPTTWDDLIKLSDKIVSDGKHPWCIGIESGSATGWPATNWIKTILSRTAPVSTYDAWVAGTLKNDSPEIRNAFNLFGTILNGKDYVYGGRAAIVSTSYTTAGLPLFTQPPGCYMYYASQYEGGYLTTAGANDLAFFRFPNIAGAPAGAGTYEIIGADLVSRFKTTNPAADAVMQYMLTEDAGTSMMKAGYYVSPFKDFDPSLYPNDVTRQSEGLLAAASTLRYDATDAMPPAVEGAYWTNITSWVNGDESLDACLTAIDAAWKK
jgi:alpha-glucoside transport system substrate-binding protein